eukprot:12856636-Alexandrium_andersonii.AAC.1
MKSPSFSLFAFKRARAYSLAASKTRPRLAQSPSSTRAARRLTNRPALSSKTKTPMMDLWGCQPASRR